MSGTWGGYAWSQASWDGTPTGSTSGTWGGYAWSQASWDGTPTGNTVISLEVTLTLATDSGGTAPYSNQLQRSAHGANSWANVGGPVVGATASFSDTAVAPSTSYDYRVVVTDSGQPPATTTSNTVTITTPAS